MNRDWNSREAEAASAAARGRFAELRGHRSLRSFAREIGVSHHLLFRFERRGEYPGLALLIALGERGVRLDWLLFGEGPASQLPRGAGDYSPGMSPLDFGPWETVEL